MLPLKLTLFIGGGFPDRTLLKKGKVVFIEFKTKSGKQSKLQEVWQRNLESLGFKYYVIRNVEEMQEVLNVEF